MSHMRISQMDNAEIEFDSNYLFIDKFSGSDILATAVGISILGIRYYSQVWCDTKL